MKIKKMSLEDFKKSMSSFYVDSSFEEEMKKKQEAMVKDIRKELKDINTREGLEKYIRSDKDALKILTSFLGISEERFKRIVSMIRRMDGDYFSTEWSIRVIRNKMINDSKYMEKICELLLEGKNNSDYYNNIPNYILDQIIIDDNKMKFIKNKYALRQHISKSFEGIYSNAVGDKIEKVLEEKIDLWCKKYNTTYVHEKRVSWITRNIDFIIPNEKNPKILIEVSYMVTTGSGQTTKQRDEHSIRLDIDAYKRKNRTEVIFVNFIDGGGWLGRQNDLELMYIDSDYVINLSNIDDLEYIIEKFG